MHGWIIMVTFFHVLKFCLAWLYTFTQKEKLFLLFLVDSLLYLIYGLNYKFKKIHEMGFRNTHKIYLQYNKDTYKFQNCH